MARVLIVDDEPDIREAVGEVLASEGFQVAQAGDGEAALDRCRDFRPDVVLLDLMMPGMNGWEFREAQRRDPAISAIPVVVVSALGRVPTIDAAAFLPKPFGLDELVALVRRLSGASAGAYLAC